MSFYCVILHFVCKNWLNFGLIIYSAVEFFHHDFENISTTIKKVSTWWKFPPLKKPCTLLTILEPQERCTISINIPFKRLNDHGDQRLLYKEVVRVFEHYNYLHTKQSGSNNDIFPINSNTRKERL